MNYSGKDLQWAFSLTIAMEEKFFRECIFETNKQAITIINHDFQLQDKFIDITSDSLFQQYPFISDCNEYSQFKSDSCHIPETFILFSPIIEYARNIFECNQSIGEFKHADKDIAAIIKALRKQKYSVHIDEKQKKNISFISIHFKNSLRNHLSHIFLDMLVLLKYFTV